LDGDVVYMSLGGSASRGYLK